MLFPPKLRLMLVFLTVGVCTNLQAARQAVVQKISISPNDPLTVQVQTSVPAVPQAQIVAGPSRLVVDVPGAVPAVSLHNQSVSRREVERVRVALFSAKPPVTRIVLDLNAIQPYRVAPTASGFTITLGAENANSGPSSPISAPTTESAPAPSAEDQAPAGERIVGWVSNGSSSANTAAKPPDPFVIRRSAPPSAKPVLVQYANGQLEIHAHDAPLADVLAMIHEQTGAEIAIPPATREERVVGDFGPGTASEVLAQLLNGTNMNFVVVASPTDPSALRNVILSPKPEGFAEYVPSDSQPAENNAQAQAPDIQPPPVVEPRPEDIPQAPPPEMPAPAADPPQN